MRSASVSRSFCKRVSPEHGLDDESARRRLDIALGRAGPQAYAAHVDYFHPLMVGPVAEGEKRRLAWARHADWIRSLYFREPIFHQDEESGLSLDKVYVKLRCCYLEEMKANEYSRSVGWLHERLQDWLANARPATDAIRMVAGGPGSGKSSFARAFACEVLDEGKFHVVFVPLQFMRLTAHLDDDLQKFLRKRWNETDPKGGAGFPESPLSWVAQDKKPLLLIFDGLDELARSEERNEDLTRKFVERLVGELRVWNGEKLAVRALVLGRSTAAQAAREEADLPLEVLLHTLPLRPILGSDLATVHERGPVDRMKARDDIETLKLDQREEFWNRWCLANERGEEPVPPGVTYEGLADLNGEPLLLYLLILTDYVGARFKEAAANRNIVYEAIFKKIYERNKEKEHWAARKLDEDGFFILLECLGLAAWAGNGRVGSDEDFVSMRDRYAPPGRRKAFKELEAAELKNVAVQFYTRMDVGEARGFAFIHKSFGEYLTARALLHGMIRLVARMENEDYGLDECSTLMKWCAFVGDAEMTAEIIRFLQCEARLNRDALQDTLPGLVSLFHWSLNNGMPAHEVDKSGTYRALEARQRCAEAAYFAMLSACSHAAMQGRDATERPDASPIWGDAPLSASALVGRLRIYDGNSTRLLLFGANLVEASLGGANLGGANLGGANLGGANLRGANLGGADLRGANLEGAILVGANLGGANLDGANLRGANLGGADLRGANLDGANLRGANLGGADLRGANLDGANLREANLDGANLGGADLRGANLDGAKLNGASLRSARCRAGNFAEAALHRADLATAIDLTQKQVNSARGDGHTRLPKGLKRPDHWEK